MDGDTTWRGYLKPGVIGAVVIQHVMSERPMDSTRIWQALDVLNRAPAGLEVYVGLVYDSAFYAATASPSELTQAAARDVQVANAFWAKLTSPQKARVTGWYIAREIHNFRAPRAQRERVKAYLSAVARGVPGPDRVLISPYFVPPVPNRPDVLGASATADLFAYLVAGTGVTDLLLQDGVGARNAQDRNLGCTWALDAYLPVAAMFAHTTAEALPRSVSFWANVEAFGDDATPARVEQQRSVTPPGKRIIVFAYRECIATGACSGVR